MHRLQQRAGALERERDEQRRRCCAAAAEARAAGDHASLWQGRAAGLTVQARAPLAL